MSHLPHPRLRRLAGILGFCFPLCVLVFIFRAPLLVAAASAWMVDQPVARADAIVILGGGVESRPFAAARMFRAGVAPQVLYINVQHYPDEELGIALSEAEQTHRIRLSNGVSETAITLIGTTVSSTYDEARDMRVWADQTGVKSIVIPTGPFHTRRVRWIFREQLRETKVELHVVAIHPSRYGVDDW